MTMIVLAFAAAAAFSPTAMHALSRPPSHSPSATHALSRPPLKMILAGDGEAVKATSMLAAGEVPRSSPDSEASKAHDLFNLVATSAVTTLTFAAFASEPWNELLAATMCAYLVADSAWIALRPEIAGGQSGGR